MQLTGFIQGLMEQGTVTVAGQVLPFGDDELRQILPLLEQYYHQHTANLPYTAPAFDAEASCWAACYLYRAVQLAMLRDADDETVNEQLKDFDGPVTAETICSADLCLRYLPDLLTLAKGLAPDDVLVKRIKETATRWPFSSVGMDIEPPAALTIIPGNACLKQAYIDRIIAARDIKRCTDHRIAESVQEALGRHTDLLWPDFKPVEPLNQEAS